MFVPYRILDAFDGNEDKARVAIQQQASIWRTGYDVTGQKSGAVSMTDAVALPNASILIPHVLSEFVKSGVEPTLIGESLLTKIQYQPGLQIQFPAIGSMYAEDVAPGAPVPEFAPDLGGHATNEIKVGKSGLAIRVFDEIIRYNHYNLVAYWLREAGRALARHKEKKIFNFIKSMGTTVFDNADYTQGISQRYTSGRKANGDLNGTMTMDDLFEMYAHCLQQGFIADTILVHPLTWLMWLRDPVLRQFQMQHGGGLWYNQWQGNNSPSNDLASFSPLGEGSGQFTEPPGNTNATSVEQYDQRLDGRPSTPSYFPWSFRIIPSHLMDIDVTNKTCDILMFNSSNLGALIVDAEPGLVEWKDPLLDMTKMQVTERYGLAVLQEGQGIVKATNIKIDRNYVADESVTPSLSISGNLADPAVSGVSPI